MADVMSGIVPRDEDMTYAEAASVVANAKAEYEAAIAMVMEYARKMPDLIKEGESMANADAMAPIIPKWTEFSERMLAAEKELKSFSESLDGVIAALKVMSANLDK